MLAVLVLAVLAVAIGAGYFYFNLGQQTGSTDTGQSVTATGVARFTFSLSQPFMHVSPGSGRQILVFVERSPMFTDSIRVELANAPSWIAFQPFTINATARNATMVVGATQEAPKTAVTLTVHASSVHGGYQEATLELKVVSTSTITSEYGAGEVYDTTKLLDQETLKAMTSCSNHTVTFAKTTAQLQTLERGDVIVSPHDGSPIVPHGFLRTVLSVQQEGSSVVVRTQQAMLIDAFRSLDVKSPEFPIGGPQTSGSSSTGAGPASISPKSVDIGPINIAAAGDEVTLEANVDFSAGVPYGFDLECGLTSGCDVDFYVHLALYQEMDVSLKRKAPSLATGLGSSLHWHDDDLETLFDDYIPILDGYLWIEIKITLQGEARGFLKENLDLNYHEYFGFEVGPDYDDGWHWFEKASDFPPSVGKSGTIEAGPPGSSVAVVSFGPKLEGSVDGAAGVYIAADFYSGIESEIPHKPSWWGIGGVEVRAGVWVDIWFWGTDKEWGPWTLFEFTMFDGWNLPPMVTVKAPLDMALVDLSLILPQRTATAFDPEDGDLCMISGAVLWSSSLDGNLGTGCSGLLDLKHAGTHVITVTATDTDGVSSTAKITLKAALPTPLVTISQPSPNAQFYTGATVTLKGMATLPPSPNTLSCDKLRFHVANVQNPFNLADYQCEPSNPPYCMAQVTFNEPGTYKISLTAVSEGGITGEASVIINIVQPPANPSPVATITKPDNGQYFQYYDDVIQIVGTANDPDGEPITSIKWYVIYNPEERLRSEFVFATDTLTTSLLASDFCSKNVTEIWIQLAASDPSGTGLSQKVKVKFGCLTLASVSPAEPIFGLTPAHDFGSCHVVARPVWDSEAFRVGLTGVLLSLVLLPFSSLTGLRSRAPRMRTRSP